MGKERGDFVKRFDATDGVGVERVEDFHAEAAPLRLHPHDDWRLGSFIRLWSPFHSRSSEALDYAKQDNDDLGRIQIGHLQDGEKMRTLRRENI